MSGYDWVEKGFYYNSAICQFFGRKCRACAMCVEACPHQALQEGETTIEIDPEKCDRCGDCVSICPSGALGQKIENWRPMSEYIQGHEGCVFVICEESSWRKLIEPQLLSEKCLPAGVEAIPVDQIGVLSEVDFAQTFLVSRKAVVVLALGENDIERPFARAAEFVGHITAHLFSEQNGRGATPLVSVIDDAETFWSRIVEIATIPECKLLPRHSLPEDEEKRQGFGNILSSWLKLVPPASPPVVIAHPGYAGIICESEKCTLCGACANHCKVDALRVLRSDNILYHTPIACLHCGACVAVCPEQALTLENGLRLDPSFFSEHVLTKCEGLHCSECDRPFTSLKRSLWVSQKLQEERGDDPIRRELLRLCPECRTKKAFFTYEEWTSKQ